MDWATWYFVAILVGLITVPFVIHIIETRYGELWRDDGRGLLNLENLGRKTLDQFRKRPLIVGAIGALVIAWSVTIAPTHNSDWYVLGDLVEDGYVTFFGAILVIMAAYFWMSRRPEI